MAEDSTNPFAGFMAALQERGGTKNEKGVVRNKVNPVLSSQEKQRYTNIFMLMREVLNPKEEVEKVKDLSSKLPGAANQVTNNMSGGPGGTGLGMLPALIGAGLIGTAVAFVTDKVDLLKMATKVAKFIPIKLLKGLPLIGSILNFGFAYKAFQEDKIAKGLWELTSGIANLFPGVGTAISLGMDMIMYMFEKEEAAAEEKGEKLDFGKWLKDKTIAIGTTMWQKLKDGKIYLFSGFYKFGEGIGYFMKDKWSKGLDSWSQILPSFFGMGGDGQEKFWYALDAFGQLLGDGVAAMDKGAEIVMGKDVWGWMKDMFKEVGTVLSDVWEGAIGWVKDIGSAAKKGLYESLPSALQDLWTGATGYDPEAEAKTAALIKAQTAANDARRAERKKYIDRAKERLGDNWRQNMLEGESISDYHNRQIRIEKEREDKEQEAIEGMTRNIQDGLIYNNGKVTRFDNQDDILAAKSGGPIDKMLNTNSKVMTEINAINQNQLNVLMQIRDGIRALSSNKSSNGPTDITFEPSTLTQEFYAV